MSWAFEFLTQALYLISVLLLSFLKTNFKSTMGSLVQEKIRVLTYRDTNIVPLPPYGLYVL